MSSRAVGGSSSSWRFGRLFSFILSVALLFGMSGARASVFLGESRALDDDWALNDSLSIAYNTSASGTIVLDVGAWYLTVKGNLIVGHNSPGTLNLGTGNVSVIPASNNLGTYIGLDSGSVGIVNVDGGIFTFGYNNNTQSTVDNGMFLIESGWQRSEHYRWRCVASESDKGMERQLVS